MSGGAVPDFRRQRNYPARVATLPLDDPTATPSQSVFDTPEGWKDYRRILSNDHDLVAQPNGDVLLIKMGQTRQRLNPKPAWFDYAYKVDAQNPANTWGPGARSELMVWRLQDCGKSFTFVSALDTAMLDDGHGTLQDFSGGLPQNSPSNVAPGSPEQPVYQMGGTDGIMARVDHATGRVYLSVQLVGNLPATGRSFTLSETKITVPWYSRPTTGEVVAGSSPRLQRLARRCRAASAQGSGRRSQCVERVVQERISLRHAQLQGQL